MAPFSNHDLDDTAGRQQASESLVDWLGKPIPVVDMDCVCWFMGIAPDEFCPVDCLRKKPSEVGIRSNATGGKRQ